MHATGDLLSVIVDEAIAAIDCGELDIATAFEGAFRLQAAPPGGSTEVLEYLLATFEPSEGIESAFSADD